MDHARATTLAYETYPEAFDAEFENHMRRYNMAYVGEFLNALSGPRVLDIGSGPGNYAAVFAARGMGVLCGDLSPAMVARCRAKGLCAEILDLASFDLNERFDGIWAHASLLHLPKVVVPRALERIALHLAPNGVFVCAVKEGEGEGMKEEKDYPATPRYFSYFQDEEFRALLAPHFDVFRFDRVPSTSGRTVFIKYMCRLREA